MKEHARQRSELMTFVSAKPNANLMEQSSSEDGANFIDINDDLKYYINKEDSNYNEIMCNNS